jgi:acid phosphatase
LTHLDGFFEAAAIIPARESFIREFLEMLMKDCHRHIGTFAVIVAFCWGCRTTNVPSDRVAPVPGRASSPATERRDTHEQLNDVLWVQSSAEYWALTSATYNGAQVLLERAVSDKSWSAALEQGGGYETLPPAVILDLDETVLDNSPAQAQLALERTVYTQEMWNAWVETMAATAIPGAQSFITFAEMKGVRVFFVTNRAASEQAATIGNLAALGIKASDETVLCSGENGWTSDKTSRRAEIARSHRVLLVVGDDMNDFVATAKLTPSERRSLAQKHADRWGRSWILLPNAMYGSWERALYAGLTNDAEILERKREQLKGFRP